MCESSSKDHLVAGRRRYITITNHLHIENEQKDSVMKPKPLSKSSKFIDLSTKSSEKPALIEDMATKRIRKKRKYDNYYSEGDIIVD